MVNTKRVGLCFCVLGISLSVWSMDTTRIKGIRDQYAQSSTPLDSAVVQVIDDFWRKSVDAMMLTEDTDEMVALRLDLKKFSGDNHLSLYASAYLKAGRKHLGVATDTVGKWEENARKVRVERNLMVLVAELESVELADLALAKLSDKDPMVRYWAVRSLTSPEIVSQLKEDVTRDEKLTSQIISALEEYLKTSPDTLTLPFVAEFAAGINTAASRKLFWTLADRRIDAYMKWTVTDESVDAGILKSIGELAPAVSDPLEKQELLSRFGRLYACVIGRYMQGEKLPQASKDRLVTVIAEVEDKIVGKQVAGWAMKFRTDLSKNIPLDKDYELLFGSEGRVGELAGRLNFNYGKDGSGKALVSPIPLPPPPKPSNATDASAAAAKP